MKSIKDVARLAGVSITTVSHYLNGTRKVSEASSQRLKAAIEQCGYVPSGVARSLRVSSTMTIGALVPGINSPFGSELAQGMFEGARDHGYALMLGHFASQPDDQVRALEDLLARRVDGLILAAGVYEHQVLVDTLARSKPHLPLVLIDHDTPDLRADSLSCDQFEYGRQATQRLLDLGHEHIACVSGPEHLYITPRRLQGWREALHAAGIEPEDDWSQFGEFSFESGYDLGKALLQRRKFTGIVAGADVIGMGILRAAYDLGLSLPDDVSMVCYDMHSMGNYVCPPLDSVGADVTAKGQQAVQMLISRVMNPSATYRHESFPTTAIWRASSGAPAQLLCG